jgi:endonuclease YncB( thermonuclease family)
MAKAIEQFDSGLIVGHVGLGQHGTTIGSVRQQVHDGDTITVRAIGNFGIRFLGVDAPEISFTLPGSNSFTSLGNTKWEAFFANWYDEETHGAFSPPLQQGLREHLKARVVAGVALNHDHHAKAAQTALEDEVLKDMQVLGQTKEDVQFFLAFAFEIMDRYGRMLCFINREQPDPNVPEPRPPSYNERLLTQAWVLPYFIWPNVNPFRKAKSVLDAVIPPGTANQINDPQFQAARAAFRAAREQHKGIYDAQGPLLLEPFEVRFLAQRRAPNRWIIDLSQPESWLINPQNYFSVTNPEDRLFVPEEYVPLFVHRGWSLQS